MTIFLHFLGRSHKTHLTVLKKSSLAFLNTGLDVQSMLLNILFTINTVFLTYNFVKAWKTEPGFIVTDREQKMQVIN